MQNACAHALEAFPYIKGKRIEKTTVKSSGCGIPFLSAAGTQQCHVVLCGHLRKLFLFHWRYPSSLNLCSPKVLLINTSLLIKNLTIGPFRPAPFTMCKLFSILIPSFCFLWTMASVGTASAALSKEVSTPGTT